jgi:hypothetical protein
MHAAPRAWQVYLGRTLMLDNNKGILGVNLRLTPSSQKCDNFQDVSIDQRSHYPGGRLLWVVLICSSTLLDAFCESWRVAAERVICDKLTCYIKTDLTTSCTAPNGASNSTWVLLQGPPAILSAAASIAWPRSQNSPRGTLTVS